MTAKIVLGGQDIGRRRAYTAFVILEIKGKVIYVKDVIQWPHVNFDVFEGETMRLYNRHNLELLIIDASGMGENVLEDYQLAGLNVEGVRFTAQTKSDMINNLLTLMTAKKLKIHPKFTELLRQLKLQHMTPGTSHTPKYTEPSGDSDDQFWALCLACWGTKRYTDYDNAVTLISKNEYSSRLTEDERREKWRKEDEKWRALSTDSIKFEVNEQ